MSALTASLHAAGLDAWANRIAATALPAILFVRHQVPDAAMPPGASKLGGTPTLPAGFAWPTRPAHSTAERKAAAHRKLGASLAQSLADMRTERLSRPLQPGERPIAAAEVDRVITNYEYVASTFSRPFPLERVPTDLSRRACAARC